MDPDVILFLLLVLIILIAVTVFAVLAYSGLFSFPTVRTDTPPINYNCTFAYQFLRGPYSSNEVGAAFTLATSIAPKALSIGIFYDDPKRVPPEKLRCAIGCVISREETVTDDEKTEDKKEDGVDAQSENVITRSFIDEKEEELLKKKSFRFCKLPRVDLAVVTEFPYTTPFSIWLAPGKVYPRLCRYMSSKGLCAYPFIELYSDNQITFMAPLAKQADFFVREANEPTDDRQSSTESTASTDTAGISAQNDETNVRRRKNVTDQKEEPVKRKDSDHASSTSSSFEEIGVEELK